MAIFMRFDSVCSVRCSLRAFGGGGTRPILVSADELIVSRFSFSTLVFHSKPNRTKMISVVWLRATAGHSLGTIASARRLVTYILGSGIMICHPLEDGADVKDFS